MTYGVNAPLGFEPVGTLAGSPWNGATRSFTIASGYGTSLFSGDPIAALTNGTIGIATIGGATLGIFNGCQYISTTGVIVKSNYWPASTAVMANTVVEAFLIIDPNMLYTIQTNTSGGATLAMNFTNFNFGVGTGSTVTGQSAYVLDLSTIATTDTLNCKLLGLPIVSSYVAKNDWGVGYNNVYVMLNNHYLRNGITSVA